MFAKLLTIILVLGLASAKLLVVRSDRLREANRILTLRREVEERRADLWRVRGETARISRPERVLDLLDSMRDRSWEPIPLPLPSLHGPADAPTNEPLAAAPPHERRGDRLRGGDGGRDHD